MKLPVSGQSFDGILTARSCFIKPKNAKWSSSQLVIERVWRI